jgi:hypothetical protein
MIRAAERVRLREQSAKKDPWHDAFTRCFEGRRARHAQAQAWNAQERPKREKGQEPQAGDRDRSVRGASEGKKVPRKRAGRKRK